MTWSNALAASLLFLAAAAPAAARPIHVAQATDPLEDGSPAHPFDAIQEGIDAAAPGDTVLVADGTYTGSGNRDIDFKGKAITVRSANGPDNCIIDCENQARGFIFHTGETPASVLSGLTITHGTPATANGAGIHCSQASPTITNNTITANTIDRDECGGGIYCEDSDARIVGNTIHDNDIGKWPDFDQVSGKGGGIACLRGAPLIANNRITSNAAGRGGGILCTSSSGTITGNTINGNGARAAESWAAQGGGIYCTSSGTLTITHNVISNNTALDADYMGMMTLGGGVRSSGDAIVFTNNTLYNNGAIAFGGGIYHAGPGSLPITNCILWANWTHDPTESRDFYQCFPSYCCIQALPPPFDPDEPPGGRPYVPVGPGNFDDDPLFADPDNRDFHLKSTGGRYHPATAQWVVDGEHSPCIDTGDPASPLGDEPMFHGRRINVGAYGGTAEASKSPAGQRCVDDTNTTGTEDGTAEHPYNTIQEAIDAATDGDAIKVARGTYSGNLTINGKWVAIQGGYLGGTYPGTGDFSDANRDPNPLTNQTAIDGGGAATQVAAQDALAEGSALSSIRFRNGGAIFRGVVRQRVVCEEN